MECSAESRNVDYKAAVIFQEGTVFAAKLVKHLLAFANSGGGHLIIGYKEQKDGSPAPDAALTEEIAKSYDVTRLGNHVGEYTQGQDSARFTIPKVEFGGIKYPIICVQRFKRYPLYCTKDYASSEDGEAILGKGCVYARTESASTCVAGTVTRLQEWRQLVEEIRATSGG